MTDIKEKIQALKKEIEDLKATAKATKEAKNDTSLKQVTQSFPLAKGEKLKLRRTLKGHKAKVYTMHWAQDKTHVLSASQDGMMIVWNGLTTQKIHAIPLRNSAVMTCAFSPSGNLVACGGLDEICSVYNLRSRDIPIRISMELRGHSGYISCCRFISDKHIVTSSADKTCILWDMETMTQITEFSDHDEAVMSLSLSPINNTFVSAGSDSLAKLWDLRQKGDRSLQTFAGNTSTINSVQFFPNGLSFGTGGDDNSCRLFDIRADRELIQYSHDSVSQAINSIAFSASGRFLFAGSDDHNVHVWDTLKGSKVYTLNAHPDRVSSLGVSSDGTSLCTASWDSFLKIWA